MTPAIRRIFRQSSHHIAELYVGQMHSWSLAMQGIEALKGAGSSLASSGTALSSAVSNKRARAEGGPMHRYVLPAAVAAAMRDALCDLVLENPGKLSFSFYELPQWKRVCAVGLPATCNDCCSALQSLTNLRLPLTTALTRCRLLV